jgi:hypothetical protein
MFAHQEQAILVLTDTLATTSEGDPHLYFNKCLPVPTMKLLVAVTGAGQMLEGWVGFLRDGLLARDISMLDAHAPQHLRRIWSKLIENDDAPPTCTVYHFGAEEDTGLCVRYVYRSTNDWQSERWAQGAIAMKPDLAGGFTDEIMESLATFDGWVGLAKQIRAEQDALPHGERIYISGEIVATTIEQTGRITIEHVHRFGDYDKQWNQMNGYPDGVVPPEHDVVL